MCRLLRPKMLPLITFLLCDHNLIFYFFLFFIHFFVVDNDQAAKDGAKDLAKYPLKFERELSAVQVESGQPCRLQCAVDLTNGLNVNDFIVYWLKD